MLAPDRNSFLGETSPGHAACKEFCPPRSSPCRGAHPARTSRRPRTETFSLPADRPAPLPPPRPTFPAAPGGATTSTFRPAGSGGGGERGGKVTAAATAHLAKVCGSPPPLPSAPLPGATAERRGGKRRAGRAVPFLAFGECRRLRALARSSSIAAAISGSSSPLYHTNSSSPGAIGCRERRERRGANQAAVCWRRAAGGSETGRGERGRGGADGAAPRSPARQACCRSAPPGGPEGAQRRAPPAPCRNGAAPTSPPKNSCICQHF